MMLTGARLGKQVIWHRRVPVGSCFPALGSVSLFDNLSDVDELFDVGIGRESSIEKYSFFPVSIAIMSPVLNDMISVICAMYLQNCSISWGSSIFSAGIE